MDSGGRHSDHPDFGRMRDDRLVGLLVVLITVITVLAALGAAKG